VDFAFSEEQEMLRAAARKYVADRFPAARVAELADAPDGWDPATWPELAQLGWLDPELGFLDHAVIFEESARDSRFWKNSCTLSAIWRSFGRIPGHSR